MSQYTKYYLYQKEQRLENSGDPWKVVIPTVLSIDGEGTMPKVAAEEDSEDCGYGKDPTYIPHDRWVKLDPSVDWICDECEAIYRWYQYDGDYICDGFNKYHAETLQVSYDGGGSFKDANPIQRRTTDLITENSIDCGYGFVGKAILRSTYGHVKLVQCSSGTTLTPKEVRWNTHSAGIDSETTESLQVVGCCYGIEAVNAFGSSAFTACTLNDEVKSLGTQLFESSGLVTIEFKHDMGVGHSCFDGCKSLTSVTGDYHIVRDMGASLFNGCSNLVSIEPKFENGMGWENDMFNGCSSLTGVTYQDYIAVAEGYVPPKEGDTSEETESETSSYVGGIYFAGFKGCTALTSMTILKPIYQDGAKHYDPMPLPFPNNIEKLNDSKYLPNCTIYVPADCLDLFRNDKHWGVVADRIQPIPNS